MRMVDQLGIPILLLAFLSGSLVLGVILRTSRQLRHSEAKLRHIEAEQAFFSEVEAVITSTTNYEDGLSDIANLVVRCLADFCLVDILEENGTIRRFAVRSRDASQQWICDRLMQVPVERGRGNLITTVLETQRAVSLERCSQEAILSLSTNDEESRAFCATGCETLLAAPLLAHGRLLGAIALLFTTTSRPFGLPDIRVVERLALDAALPVANARLVAESQRVVKAREEALAIVSHDLKNPVTTIKLVLHLLRQFEGVEARKLGRFVETIQRAVDKMQLLITDLLDFDKIQGGTFSVKKDALSLNGVASPVVEGFRLLAHEKRQVLELDVPGDLPQISADAHRIDQAISNLVGNAIKFTPEGGSIRLSARLCNDEVIVSVTDTGPGIPSEYLPKIFDWFWQAPGAEQMGSGLGLSITKGIVEAHGGRIWVESEPGKGSSFSFSLPAEKREEIRSAA